MKNDASQPQNIVILFLIIKNKQFPFESVCTFMGTVICSFTNAEGPFTDAEEPFTNAEEPFTDAEEPFTDAEGPFTYVESTLFAMPSLCENKNK